MMNFSLNLISLKKFLRNKKVLIVGGGPSAAYKDNKWYETFDCIVRCNNYKTINSNRTDIFFSYFGKNISKSDTQLKREGVKFLINKCPNADMTKDFEGCPIEMKDYRWIYEDRTNWWFRPLISLSRGELIRQVNMLDGYMPSVGLSAILFLHQYCNIIINIIGFDCFESKIHNLNEPWDNTGNHNIIKEREILEDLNNRGSIIWNKS